MKVGTAIISMRIYAVNLAPKPLRKEIYFAVSHSNKFLARSAQKSEQHLLFALAQAYPHSQCELCFVCSDDPFLITLIKIVAHFFSLSFFAAVQYFSSLLILWQRICPCH